MPLKKKSVDLVCDIAELISLAGSGPNRKELLQSVVTAVAGHMRADVCSVYIYDEDEGVLTLRATEGLSKDAVGTVKL